MNKSYLCAIIAGAIGASAMAQSVTVGTTGATYTSLNAAIQAVGDDAAEPDIITVIDEGPFYENRIIINSSSSGTTDLTIQASPGLRPIIVVDQTNSGSKTSAAYLRKSGTLLFKDLIIIPTATGITDGDSYREKVASVGIEIVGEPGFETSVTLQNILVSSNNGSDEPVASLDGLSAPVFTPNSISFTDEGIYLPSYTANALRKISMYDVVVSGIEGSIIEDLYGPPPPDTRGNEGSDGIRGFPDGLPGSEWVIGAGTVISYNNTFEDNAPSSTSSRAAFQPGGTAGFSVRVEGTPDNPVKLINNNLNGISVTNSIGAADGLTAIEWCIIANNSGAALNITDGETPIAVTNATFANNAQGGILSPANQLELGFTFSNVIAAGNGDPNDYGNAITLVSYGGNPSIVPAVFNATYSAIVLNGPYTLNNTDFGGDGINNDASWTVVTANNTNADPQFVTLDPTAGGFAVVANQAYATAGPGGQPLVGGGSMAQSSVEDWQLF